MHALKSVVWIPLAAVSGVVFVAAVAAHLLSFSLDPWIRMDFVWPITILILVAFVGVIAFRRLQFDQGPNVTPWFLGGRLPADGPSDLRLVPGWMWIPLGLLAAYAVFTFGAFMAIKGMPGVIDGEYVMSQNGSVIRTLTEAEFRQAEALVVRGLSGPCMVLSTIPLVYFGVIQPRRLRYRKTAS